MLDIPSGARPGLAPPRPLTSGKTLDRRLGDLARILSSPANKTTDTPAERARMAVTQTLIEVTAWVGEMIESDEARAQEESRLHGLRGGAPVFLETKTGRIQLIRRAAPKGSVEMHSQILMALQTELAEFAMRQNRQLCGGEKRDDDEDPRRWT